MSDDNFNATQRTLLVMFEVAWSGHLQPTLKTDVTMKSFFGRGSGESIQMCFEGDGWVVVQPYEEVYCQTGG